MDSTVTLKGITFTVKRWGESDLYTLDCPHCHPGVDFKKGETVEVDGIFYLVYLVNEHSLSLQRMRPCQEIPFTVEIPFGMPASQHVVPSASAAPLTVGHVDFGRTTLTAAVLFTQNPPASRPEGTIAETTNGYPAEPDPAVQPVSESERHA